MAELSQSEWYAKLKAFLPNWFWESEEITKAHFEALAGLLEAVQQDVADHVDGTFITRATGEYLDAHGGERRVTRLPGEVDPQYSSRVQNLFNQSNVPDIKAFVDEVLVNGEARLQEDFESVIFADRSWFCNRAAVFTDKPYHNTFSVVVNKQVHEAFSFTSREYFLDREESFLSTSESLDFVFELIVQIVDDLKAFGTFYRVIELLEA